MILAVMPQPERGLKEADLSCGDPHEARASPAVFAKPPFAPSCCSTMPMYGANSRLNSYRSRSQGGNSRPR